MINLEMKFLLNSLYLSYTRINQSTSFRMLNRWIQEAEAHPKQVEPEQRRHTEKLLQESKGELNLIFPFFRKKNYYKFSQFSIIKQNVKLNKNNSRTN